MQFWQIVFWLLMLLWLIGVFTGWPTPAADRPRSLVLWVLLAILGAYAIGFPPLPGR